MFLSFFLPSFPSLPFPSLSFFLFVILFFLEVLIVPARNLKQVGVTKVVSRLEVGKLLRKCVCVWCALVLWRDVMWWCGGQPTLGFRARDFPVGAPRETTSHDDPSPLFVELIPERLRELWESSGENSTTLNLPNQRFTGDFRRRAHLTKHNPSIVPQMCTAPHSWLPGNLCNCQRRQNSLPAKSLQK